MFKYLIFGVVSIFSATAQAEVINYVTPSQAEMGTVSGSGVKNVVVEDDDFFDLDKIGAEHGDAHAMGTLANSCLKKEDYVCAYKWSGIALRSSYWKSVGQEDAVKSIQDEAAKHLSAKQVSELDIAINEFRPRY